MNKTERITNLSTPFLECRTLGHAWTIRWWGSLEEMPTELIPHVARVFRWVRVRVSICQRCETIRDEFFPKVSSDIDSHQAQYRRYRYADGYQMRGVGQSPPRRLFNKAAYDRWKTGDPEFK